MSVVVITAPAPIVTPGDIPGDHDDDDARVRALIAAATEQIDGPTGWLGRALGPQTLELRLDRFYDCGRAEIGLPYPPLISVESVKYDAVDGSEQTIPSSSYGILGGRGIYPKPGFAWPSVRENGQVRIRFKAGYDGPTTGDVPERVKQAIILIANEMKAASAENLFLASEDVVGVSSQRYAVSTAASEVVQRAVERLLAGLRVFA